jgi:hypothetical protein
MPCFYPPVTRAQLSVLEHTLDIVLPDSWVDIFQETDGITTLWVFPERSVADSGPLWSIADILRYNQTMRQQAQQEQSAIAFTDIVFFADAGTDSIRFASYIQHRKVQPEVYAWYPLEGVFCLIASSLDSYLQNWITNKIQV